MNRRPYVITSCAMSVDGRIDDAGSARLLLSGEADLDRVDALRASCDAILVGANTVRRDNPRLLIRSARRRAERTALGRPEHPARVTLTASGNLGLSARFFAPQDGGARPPLVYCASPAAAAASARLGKAAEVIDAGDPLSLSFVLRDLSAERGVARVLAEGGSILLRQLLTAGLADELHLAVAPFFVGQAEAPSFGLPGRYPHDSADPMTLAGVRRLDDVVALHYLLGPGGADRRYLRAAIELSRQCPPSRTAFSVGAIIVAGNGEVMATGYSREEQDHDHAEEVALRKAGPADPRLPGATMYSSLVPCGARASRPRTCVQHIVSSGIRRVVYAWREPPVFTGGRGAEQLRDAGITVLEIPGLAETARAVNAHLVPGGGPGAAAGPA